MKLTGAKYLDANDYNRLVIKNLYEDLKVNVSGTIESETLKSDFPFSKDLRNMSEDEAITQLVDYFLRYNHINGVEECAYLPRHTGHFTGISSDKSNMFLQVPLNDNTRKIPKKILDKFYLDRYLSCMCNDDIKNYEFYTASKSAYKEEETQDKKTMKIYLNRIPLSSSLMKVEAKFLREFLKEKLDSFEEEIYLEETGAYFTVFEQFLNTYHYLKIGDTYIWIKDKSLLPIIEDIIMEHNNEIRNAKSMQLRMKGY